MTRDYNFIAKNHSLTRIKNSQHKQKRKKEAGVFFRNSLDRLH